jgi:TRAP-type C4-dicarboxylate transport system permease small subunit
MSSSSQNAANANLPPRTKLQSALIGVVDAAAVAALVAMMLHVLSNVFARSVLNTTVPHTFELTQYYYLPILASLGFVAAQHRGEHITAEVFYSLFSRGEKRLITVMTTLAAAVVAFGFAYYTFDRAQYAGSIRMVYGVTSLQVWPVLYLLPVCFAVMGALILVRGLSEWRLPESAPGSHGELQSNPVNKELHGEELM